MLDDSSNFSAEDATLLDDRPSRPVARPRGEEVVDRKKAETGEKLPSPAPEAPAVPVVPAAKPAKKGKRRLVLLAVLAAVIAGGAYYGHYWWTEGRFLVSTDDAYVSADMAILSPKVTGYVDSVPVKENQAVKSGDPIVVIDDGDYRLAQRSAEAKIATQRATVDRIRAQRQAAEEQVGEATAERAAADAALNQANVDLKRAEDLLRTKVGSRAQLDQAMSVQNQAAAKLAGADAAIAAAKANVLVLDAQAKEAESTIGELEIARDQAARDLSFTTLKAPYDGVVGNLAVQPGDLVSAGRRLAAIVPMSKVFVDANFKETQLGEILPGEKVSIEIDAMPGREFTGTVTSLSPASGSVFSLLPADNATGNFTKVVQRVPVRVEIDHPEQLNGHLRPGLSAVVSVDTRTAP